MTEEKIREVIDHNNEGNSISSIARLVHLSKATVQRIIWKYGSMLRKPEVSECDEEYEIDELCTYVDKKKNLVWITYAINKWTRQVIDLVVAKDFVPGANIAIKLARGEKITAQDWILEGVAIIPIGRIVGRSFKLVSKSGNLITTGLKGAGKLGGDACMDFAGDFMKKFKTTIESAGGSVRRMEINIGNNGLIGTFTEQLATTGRHQYIEVVIDGKTIIFDNHFINGIPKGEYIRIVEGSSQSRGVIPGKILLEEAKEVTK